MQLYLLRGLDLMARRRWIESATFLYRCFRFYLNWFLKEDFFVGSFFSEWNYYSHLCRYHAFKLRYYEKLELLGYYEKLKGRLRVIDRHVAKAIIFLASAHCSITLNTYTSYLKRQSTWFWEITIHPIFFNKQNIAYRSYTGSMKTPISLKFWRVFYENIWNASMKIRPSTSQCE